VIASSVNALGVFTGESLPDYLPIDDLHPARPLSAYGMSKRAVERVAGVMSREGGLTTISLRPAGVLDDAMVDELRARRRDDPSSEWLPAWEYGAWIHVEDLADAVVAALDCPTPPGGSATVLLAAADVCSDELPAREQVRRFAPGVEWRGGSEYDDDPYRSLIDTSRARVLLGWQPNRSWPRARTPG
jgi:nucleoside-diphosphate-sugar epimerase